MKMAKLKPCPFCGGMRPRACIHGTRAVTTRRDPLSGRRAAVQVVECRRTAGRLFMSRPCDHCNYWEGRG